VTGERKRWEIDLPEDIQALSLALRKDMENHPS
jgi:hypothetical protein